MSNDVVHQLDPGDLQDEAAEKIEPEVSSNNGAHKGAGIPENFT